MRLLICLTITIALVTPLVAQTPKPIPTAAEAQAKQELNEAARAYREGRFTEAQAHSEKALALDPNNRAAPMFVARTIQAQYKIRDSTPENVAIDGRQSSRIKGSSIVIPVTKKRTKQLHTCTAR